MQEGGWKSNVSIYNIVNPLSHILWWDKSIAFSTKGSEVKDCIQMIEFPPSNLKSGQIKVYFSTLTWAKTGRVCDTILCLNGYKHILIFFSL